MKSSDFWSKWKIKLQEFIKDKNLATYLVFVVISFVFLYLHALGKEYTTNFQVDVKYQDLPVDKELELADDDKITLNVTGYGFSLLRIYLNSIFSTYGIDVSLLEQKATTFHALEYNLPIEAVRQQLQERLGDGVRLNSIYPNHIVIPVRTVAVKTVPVLADVVMALKSGYILENELEIIPDSIVVRGDAQIIDTLQGIWTETVELRDVLGSFNREVRLLEEEQKLELLVDENTVHIKGEVVASIAEQRELHIRLINFPDSLTVELYPSVATLSYVSYQGALKEITDADFNLVVDYNLVSKTGGKLEVQVLHIPKKIFNVHIKPRYVDYVIKRKKP